MDRMTRTNTLRALRMESGLRGVEFAEQIGYHEAHLRKVETGRAVPSKIMLQRAATVLSARLGREITADDLIEDPPTQPPGRARTPQPSVSAREPVPV